MSAVDAVISTSGTTHAYANKMHLHQSSDLSVQVVEELLPSGKGTSFDYVGSIKSHPQLIEEEKHSLLWLLAQSPAFHDVIKAEDLCEGHELPDWVKCAGMMGIHISRQDPDAPERVYKMRGVTEVPASAEVGLGTT